MTRTYSLAKVVGVGSIFSLFLSLHSCELSLSDLPFDTHQEIIKYLCPENSITSYEEVKLARKTLYALSRTSKDWSSTVNNYNSYWTLIYKYPLNDVTNIFKSIYCGTNGSLQYLNRHPQDTQKEFEKFFTHSTTADQEYIKEIAAIGMGPIADSSLMARVRTNDLHRKLILQCVLRQQFSIDTWKIKLDPIAAHVTHTPKTLDILLCRCTQINDVENVTLLLHAGADAQGVDEHGNIPAYYAAQANNVQIMTLFLNLNTPANWQNFDGQTLSEIAYHHRDKSTLRLIQEKLWRNRIIPTV